MKKLKQILWYRLPVCLWAGEGLRAIGGDALERDQRQCDRNDRLALENPFASRYVRPGALRFIFSDGSNMADLVDRLQSSGSCGSITGPHGSGKSTLLADVDAALADAGCAVQRIGADEPAAAALRPLAAVSDGVARVLLVDGYDLIPGWRRWWLRHRCRRKGIGLLVTSHRPVGMPVLMATSTSALLAMQLARTLAGEGFAGGCEMLIRDLFARHRGNLREVWFDLYDRYERCNRLANPEMSL